MNNTTSLQSNSSQSELELPHINFSFARKDYTIAEVLTVFSADFLDLIYQHNVIPPESPFAAIRVIIPIFNLLIIVLPSFTHYKVNYCDDCPTLGQRLTSELRPLLNNRTLTQVQPPSPNHLVAHTVKRINNPPPKSHHLKPLIKNHKHKKLKNTPTQSLIPLNIQKFAQNYLAAKHLSINVQSNLKHSQYTKRNETPKYIKRERSLLLMGKTLENLNPQ